MITFFRKPDRVKHRSAIGTIIEVDENAKTCLVEFARTTKIIPWHKLERVEGYCPKCIDRALARNGGNRWRCTRCNFSETERDWLEDELPKVDPMTPAEKERERRQRDPWAEKERNRAAYLKKREDPQFKAKEAARKKAWRLKKLGKTE